MSDSFPVVVVKLGGSLFDWPDFPGRARELLDSIAPARVVLVPGGGRFVDVLRDLDRIHSIGEESSHDLAMRLLDATAAVLAALIGGVVVEDRGGLDGAWSAGAAAVLAPRKLLESDGALPHSWEVTSDSIAARVAVRLEASRLILAKSATPADADVRRLVESKFVDENFPGFAREIGRVEVVDLRGPDATPIRVRF